MIMFQPVVFHISLLVYPRGTHSRHLPYPTIHPSVVVVEVVAVVVLLREVVVVVDRVEEVPAMESVSACVEGFSAWMSPKKTAISQKWADFVGCINEHFF